MNRELKIRVALANGESVDSNIVDVCSIRRSVIVVVDDESLEIPIDKVIFI